MQCKRTGMSPTRRVLLRVCDEGKRERTIGAASYKGKSRMRTERRDRGSRIYIQKYVVGGSLELFEPSVRTAKCRSNVCVSVLRFRVSDIVALHCTIECSRWMHCREKIHPIKAPTGTKTNK